MSGGSGTECINEKGGFFASGCFGTVFTLLAQFRFRCSEVLLQPKTYDPKHQYCGREMLPLRGSVAPAEDPRAPRRRYQYCGREMLPLRGSVASVRGDRSVRNGTRSNEVLRGWCSSGPRFGGRLLVEARLRGQKKSGQTIVADGGLDGKKTVGAWCPK